VVASCCDFILTRSRSSTVIYQRRFWTVFGILVWCMYIASTSMTHHACNLQLSVDARCQIEDVSCQLLSLVCFRSASITLTTQLVPGTSLGIRFATDSREFPTRDVNTFDCEVYSTMCVTYFCTLYQGKCLWNFRGYTGTHT